MDETYQIPQQSIPNTSNKTLFNYPKKHKTKSDLLKDDKHDYNSLLHHRIELNSHTGTILYCGPLLHKEDPDIWLGISWDDPSRGKHNGTVDNVTYFSVNNNSGSLIKLSKVNFGISIGEALNFKYKFNMNNSTDLYKFIESSLYVQTKTRKINIEFIGQDKALKKYSEFQENKQIDLCFSFISEIEDNCNECLSKGLKELVLEKTLLSRWSQVLFILMSFPNLEILDLSENKFFFDEEFYKMKKENSEYFNNIALKSLVLNKNFLRTQDLKKIAFFLKNVDSLFLFNNLLYEEDDNNVIKEQEEQEQKQPLSNLRHLSLDRNKLTNLSTFFAHFDTPNLEILNLNDNDLTSLTELSNYPSLQKSLKNLFIDNNFLQPETLFLDLSLFTNIVELHIMNNAFVSKLTPDFVKINLIGRLPSLKYLNNSFIDKETRRDHEILYLKFAVKEYFEKYLKKDEIFEKSVFEEVMKKLHSNYFYLRRKYFDPVEDYIETKDVQNTNKIKDNIVELEVIGVNCNGIEGQRVKRKLPKTSSFATIKNVFAKLLKMSGMKLVFEVNGEDVTDETKTLENFSLISGGQIKLKMC